MREYTVNFIIWLYWYTLKDVARYVYARFIFILLLTKTLPMIRNIYRPMFGDNTAAGIFIGVFIRFWWALFGGIISILYIIPFVLFLIGYILLPLIPVIQLIRVYFL